ncbi:MAG: hypothetical protein RLZZ04_4731 [Cyanobacteriota bacterium]|jgi:hypothetical protein
MPDQKISKANGTEGFFIATNTVFSVFFSYSLIRKSLGHSSILEISSILIWIIVCIIQIYLQSKKLINSKSENTLNNQDKYQVSPTVQKLIGVIVAFIVGILLLVLLGGDINVFKTQTQLVGSPEFEPFSYGSNIVLGISVIIGTLMELFELKKSLLRSILLLFQIMLAISGMVMYLTYTIHLTEVNL